MRRERTERECIDPPVVIILPEPRTIETLGTTAPGVGEPSMLKFGWSRIGLALGYLSGMRVPP